MLTSRLTGTKAMFTGIVEEMGKVEELQMDLMTPGALPHQVVARCALLTCVWLAQA